MVGFDLKRLGVDPATALIHIDGPRTTQKIKARTERNKVINTKRVKAVAILNSAKQRASQGQRCKTQSFYTLLGEIRAMTDPEKESIVEGLAKLGWHAHICSGEADVCVARAAAASNDTSFAALTRDSDMLMHRPVTKVLMPAKGGLELITREDVLKAFQMDEDQLQLLAVVSTSDFCKSVPQYGLIRNHKAIKRLRAPPSGAPDRLRRLLQLYQRTIGRPDITNSWSIFVNRQETRAAPEAVVPQGSNSTLILEMLEARHRYISNLPRKNDKGKKKKKKVDDDTFERPRISARAARDLKYGIKIKGIVS
ncbi:hypothetical protein BGZ72_002676 [Mortierella alpina]|nr:hypothetical protein BGZ72_002676 [Mortierella alpina]